MDSEKLVNFQGLQPSVVTRYQVPFQSFFFFLFFLFSFFFPLLFCLIHVCCNLAGSFGFPSLFQNLWPHKLSSIKRPETESLSLTYPVESKNKKQTISYDSVLLVIAVGACQEEQGLSSGQDGKLQCPATLKKAQFLFPAESESQTWEQGKSRGWAGPVSKTEKCSNQEGAAG